MMVDISIVDSSLCVISYILDTIDHYEKTCKSVLRFWSKVEKCWNDNLDRKTIWTRQMLNLLSSVRQLNRAYIWCRGHKLDSHGDLLICVFMYNY